MKTTTEMHLVFVYGTLKRGLHNHRWLADNGAEFLGEAITRDPHRLFVDGLPFLVEGPGEHQPGARVRGELYKVSPLGLKALDYLEGHPSFYERRLAPVLVGSTEMEAWIYFHPESERFTGLVPVPAF